DKCLIATGGHPRNLPEIAASGQEVLDRVTLFRNIKDVLPFFYTSFNNIVCLMSGELNPSVKKVPGSNLWSCRCCSQIVLIN
uniref:hypothetical protein n=1 Tax=Salmonella sp. s51944 TaxID=3159655 RepID=UPI00397FC450